MEALFHGGGGLLMRDAAAQIVPAGPKYRGARPRGASGTQPTARAAQALSWLQVVHPHQDGEVTSGEKEAPDAACPCR